MVAGSGSRGICEFLVSLGEILRRCLEVSGPTLPDLTVLLEDIASCDVIVVCPIIIEMMTGVILRVQFLFELNEFLGMTG